MKLTLVEIKNNLVDLLENAGFSDDMYIISINNDNVSVQFDDKGAVDYFKGDYDYSTLSKMCSWEYRKEGKRHTIRIYSW